MGYFCKQRITAKEKLSELSKQNKGTDGLSFSALRNFRNKSLCHSKFLCFWWLLTAILLHGLRNDFFSISSNLLFPMFTWTFIFFFYLDFYFPFLWELFNFFSLFISILLPIPFFIQSWSDFGFFPIFFSLTKDTDDTGIWWKTKQYIK